MFLTADRVNDRHFKVNTETLPLTLTAKVKHLREIPSRHYSLWREGFLYISNNSGP